MSTAELKLKLFRHIDALDGQTTKELYGVIMNFFNAQLGEEEWNSLSKKQQDAINIAIDELDAGQGRNHSKVISNYRKKYTDA